MPIYTIELDNGRRVRVEADSPEDALDTADAYAQQAPNMLPAAIASLNAATTAQAQNPGIGQHPRGPAPTPPPRPAHAAIQPPATLPSPQSALAHALMGAGRFAVNRGADAAEAITGRRPELPTARSNNPLVDALMGGPAGVTGSITNAAMSMIDPDAARAGGQSTVNSLLPLLLGDRGQTATSAVQSAEQERRGSGNLTPAERNPAEMGAATLNYQPSTYAGGVSNRAGQMLPYALAPGGALPTALGFGTGEAARGAGATLGANEEEQNALGFGGNLAGALAGTAFVGPRPYESILRNATRALTPENIAQARALMEGSQGLPNGGIRLAGDEALAQVGGPRAAPLQGRVRQLSRTASGAERMAEFNADRPGQIRAATEGTADLIAPPITDPIATGVQARGAAGGALSQIRSDINAGARPSYEALPGQSLPPAEFEALMQNPSFRMALEEVVRNPEMAPLLQRGANGEIPLNDLNTLNLVQTRLRTMEQNATENPTNPSGDNTLSMLRGRAAGELDDLAGTASRDWTRARGIVSQGRGNFLEPATEGPLGDISRTADIQSQSRSLYPSAPPEGRPGVTAQALADLEGQAPGVGASLTRSHLIDALNQGTRRIQGGENLMGGANVANTLAGNAGARGNFMAGVGEVAPDAAPTVATLLEALQASGTRRGEGSPTATDARGIQEMGAMDAPMQAGITALQPLRSMQRLNNALSDQYANWSAQDVLNVLESDPATFERTLTELQRPFPRNVDVARRTTALIKALVASEDANLR